LPPSPSAGGAQRATAAGLHALEEGLHRWLQQLEQRPLPVDAGVT
jgi:hypothetical protein